MDGDATSVEVFVGSFDADRQLSERISRAAEACCTAADDGGSFVMITTELREQAVVKLVRFEDAAAAALFRRKLRNDPTFEAGG